jgi:pyrimidine deaminase RibD-like protein
MTHQELDQILIKLCDLLVQGQETDPDLYGMVGACIVGPDGQQVGRLNYRQGDKRVHAEHAALDAYEKKYGPVNADCICVTTLSPCSNPMADRLGIDCESLLADHGITKVYAGYCDPSQSNSDYQVTDNDRIQAVCKRFADTFLNENFKDGKHPGRKGLAKRSGVNTKASVSSLRKTAKNSTGEKARMAHWLANMKSGRAKASKK